MSSASLRVQASPVEEAIPRVGLWMGGLCAPQRLCWLSVLGDLSSPLLRALVVVRTHGPDRHSLGS